MNNYWFAIEDRTWASSLKNTKFNNQINPTWFPATGHADRPFPYLLDATQRSQVDLLFYQSYYQPLPSLSLLRQVPTIILLDGAPLRPFIREPRRSSNQAFKSLLRNLKSDEKMKVAAKQAAGFVVWSEWARQELIRNFEVAANRVLVARSGVDLNDWDASQEAFQITRRPARTLPERIHFLFAGDNFEGLGGDLLLDVFRNDPDLADLSELHLITRRAGATGSLEKLGPTSKLPIYLHSFDAPADVYLNSDIFVLPAHAATSPSQLATALAAGLPIIAAGVEGLTELVQDGSNGLLVTPNDPAALGKAMHTLIDDPALRYQLGLGSRQLAEHEFQAAATSQQLLTFAAKVSSLGKPVLIPQVHKRRVTALA